MAERLPAEWEPHARTVIAWPGRAEVWDHTLEAGRAETLALAVEIASREAVTIAAAPDQAEAVRARAGDGIDIVSIPLDDCWARDISPLFVVNADGVRGVDFEFNAWGGKFDPVDADREFGRAISQSLGIPVSRVQLVLEGGSVSTDGQGSAIIVEPTILNDNRNPGATKAGVEAILARELGIETVIWLPFGLLGDKDTDGHVDNVAVFCAPGRVLVQAGPSSSHPDAERLERNLMILRNARDASGQLLEVVEVPWLPVSPFDEGRPSSYVNSYAGNGAVYVPVVGAETDEAALALISRAFDGRMPVPVEAKAMSFAGGGPHCMTMQIPKP